MEMCIDGLRINMARNVLNCADELNSYIEEWGVEEKEIQEFKDSFDQVLRDIRFLGCIDFRKNEDEKDGGFIYEKMDKMFENYIED